MRRLRRALVPRPVGGVRFGSLRRLSPISLKWGFDRGLPVDRHYIARFMAEHADRITGHVLEIGDNYYTRCFGSGVTRSDILHVEPGNQYATIIADLTSADAIPSETFDCIVFTQTLQCIYDVHAVVRTLYRLLKPGGTVLATMPGITKVSSYDAQRWGDYWRFTAQSAARVFRDVFPASGVTVCSYGNVLAAAAFLYGLATHELRDQELEARDPDYEVVIGLRAEKPLLPSSRTPAQ